MAHHPSFEQQTCPACDGTVDQQATRCWQCGHRFGDTPVRRVTRAAAQPPVEDAPDAGAVNAVENTSNASVVKKKDPSQIRMFWVPLFVANGCIVAGAILFVGGMSWGMSGASAGGPWPGSEYAGYVFHGGIVLFWVGVVWAVLYVLWRIIAALFGL